MTVLVTGSRGTIGATLVRLLRKRGVDVRAASSAAAPGTVRCDLTDPATFPAALAGVESIFLYAHAGTAAEFAEQAHRAGAQHIVLLSSAMAASGRDHHHAAELALRTAPVPTTILRPGTFAGNALQWSRSIREQGAVALPYPGAHTDPLHEADLAEAAAAVLGDPRHHGATHTLTGLESLTFAEQIERIAATTARPIRVDAISREDWKAQMAQHIPARFADSLLDHWQHADGVPAELTPTVARLTGHPARTFADWARDHRADFTP